MIGTYWIFLAGIVYLAGSSVASLLVTEPTKADKCLIDGRNRSCGRAALNLAFMIAAVSLGANIVHVVLHCSVVTETSIREIWDILPDFLIRTRYGRISLARIIIHGFLVVATGISLIKNSGILSYFRLLFTLSVLIAIALSGHQGTKGLGSINLYMDVLHILAVSVWIGGLLYIRCGYSSLLRCSNEKYMDRYVMTVNRFSMLATISVSLVIVTGIWMLLAFPKNVLEILETNFGIALAVKVVLVAAIGAIGGINKFILIPRINRSAGSDSENIQSARMAFHRAVTAESLIGLSALLATAVLTHLSPMD